MRKFIIAVATLSLFACSGGTDESKTEAAADGMDEAALTDSGEVTQATKVNMTETGKAVAPAGKNEKDITMTDSGMKIEKVENGDPAGTSPKMGETVTVHYRGTFTNGEQFDSSYDRGEPAQFPVGGLIEGWNEALLMMVPGDKWKLTIPPELAYGVSGKGPIGPNETLLFDIELISVN